MRQIHLFIPLFLSLFLLIIQQTTTEYAGVAGEWHGSIELDNGNLDVRFIFGYGDGELDGTIDIPQQMAYNLPVEFTAVRGDSLQFEFQTGSGPALFRGAWNRDDQVIRGTFHQMNLTFPFEISKENGGGNGRERDNRETELTIPTRAGQVSGTLVEGESDAPLVILLTGSGAQDRNETVAGFRVFGTLADHLYSEGFSTYRYDDRGVGRSTGTQDATLYDLSDDLEDILDYFRSEFEGSFSEFILLGHSQGGMVAAITARRTDVGGIIFMGAPFLPGDQIIDLQIETISEAQGISEEIVEQNLAFQQRIYDVVRSEGDWSEVETDLYERLEQQINELPEQQREALGDMSSFIRSQINRQLAAAKTNWFRSFIEYDPAADITELQIPMLALFGEKDTQVILHPNREAAEKLLEEANLSLEIVTIESANHLFQVSNSGLPSEYGMLERAFAETFIESLTDWLNRLQ
jgi:uncharacterized protein